MIKGQKINLRLIKDQDLKELPGLLNNLENRGEYLGLELTSEVLIKKYFAESGYWSDDFGRMLITSKTKAEKIIGNITFFKGINGAFEVGYQIYRKEDRGKGYGSEALKLFSKYLFELKEINRLQITVPHGNIASRAIAEKCGYKHEGTLRQAYFARGKYHDIQIFSLLREEVLKEC